MSYKKYIAVLIIFSLLLVFVPQKSQAQYVDVIQAPKELILDNIAVVMAKMMLKRLTAQTVNWINSGFKGNPMYVTDPGQFFLDSADNTASKFLSETQLNKLCSPFKAQVRLALVKNYLQEEDNYSCTLSTLKDNYDAFVRDFSVGGWDGWFEMTQTSGGNPYSAYFAAQSDLLKTVSNQQTQKEKEIELGGGFLSQKKCKSGTEFTQADVDRLALYNMNYEVGDCYESDKETVTPGAVINDGLKKALGTGWGQLEAADEINEVITALVTQLIGRVVGGIGDGLRGASKPSSTGGGGSYTEQLRNELQPDPVDANSLTLSPSTMKCVTDENTGEQNCTITPGNVSGPEWASPVDVQTSNLPSPAQCLQQDGNYAGPLMEAMQAVLSANPSVASSLNTAANSFAFLALVTANPPSGYNVTDQVLNGNDNPNRGDLLAIWRNGDSKMERYDVVGDSGGGNKTMANALQTDFTGSISLDCTRTGGGRGCHCEYAPTTPTPTPTPASNPEITSISPASIMPGGFLTINGRNLTATVQFFSSSGVRDTQVGSGGGNQVTIQVPRSTAPGNYTVKIYKTADSVSNGKLLVVKAKTAPTIPTIQTTSSWTPPQTINGWWSKISPDGRYVAYGNWGESWVTDLDTKQNYDFKKPAGLPSDGRCIAGQWIKPDTLSFVCEIGDRASGGFYRYEVKVGQWTAVKTSDDSGLVNGNAHIFTDGHWTSYLASGGRIAQDNKIVISGVGGAMSVSGDKIVHACANDENEICVRKNDGTLLKKYTTRTPNFGTATKDGYIAYGGYGPVRGITSTGTDIDLTVTPWRKEWVGPGGIIYVGTTPWVVTTTWDDDTGNGFIVLRPWGESRAIAVVGDAVGASVAVRGNNFVIAYWSDVGKMYVVTVPVSSERKTLN